MERRSLIWRRKSADKSPGGEAERFRELESSHSERYSDEQQDRHGSSPTQGSPNNVQSSEISSSVLETEVQEPVKSLSEKLSAALHNISAKEDLVNQHAKVAEEAVAGWEQAEAEVATLKQQLEVTVEKNSILQERINQLDEALKDSAKQLHQSREEQDTRKDHECHSNKSDFEKEIVELKAQLEHALSKTGSKINDHNLQEKLEAFEKENMSLKLELVAQYKNLEVLSVERELSNRAAETASKQYLESMKEVGMLEAQCHRLRSLSNRFPSVTVQKSQSHSACVESLTDSHSDSGERLLSVDTEPGCSDLWANALIAELDQFKNKASERKLVTSVEIDFMDDFLEMERLVALPEGDCSCSSFEPEVDSEKGTIRGSPSEVDHDVTNLKLIQLEERVQKLESEKAVLETALFHTKSRLEASSCQLTTADHKLLDLKEELKQTIEMKHEMASKVKVEETKNNDLGSQLELSLSDVGQLNENILNLEQKIECEKALSVELAERLEAAEAARMTLQEQFESAVVEANTLRTMLGVLHSQLEQGKILTSELVSKLAATEVVKKTLETQLEDEYLKEEKLQDKISLLGMKAEEEQTLSVEMASKVSAAAASKHELEYKLNSAQMEIKQLNDKVNRLEGKIAEESALCSKLTAHCHKLEHELSKIKKERDLRKVSRSNGEVKIKQETELAVAAEKFAQCQKTIASLGLKLKSLTKFDEFVLEAEPL